MSLQFTSGPFAGRAYTTNTFTPGRAQPRPTPSQGTPYGGQAFQGNLGGQYNAQPANGPSPGAYAPGTGMPPGQFTGAMQPPASSYQPPQGPYGSTTYAGPGGGWLGSSPPPPSSHQPPQPPGQQGGNSPPLPLPGPSRRLPVAYQGPVAGATYPQSGHRPTPSSYKPPQGPYISTTYAYPGGGWGHSPQPPGQQGGYRPQPMEGGYRPQESSGGYRPQESQGGYRPATAMMRRSR